MSLRSRNEYAPDQVSLPGETLQEVLEDLGLSQAELAERMGRPRKTVNEIIQGKAAITPDTAIQLERVVGVPASFWSNLESHYRAYLAREDDRARLKSETAWLREIPVRQLINLEWIAEHSDKADQVRELLGFFGVASVAQWRRVHAQPQAAFRQSSAFQIDPGAVAAWLRRGAIEAQTIKTRPFSKPTFRSALKIARDLTVKPPERFVPELTTACKHAGVAVVFIPEVKGCRASGAARWLTPEKALIQLSLRYKSDDQLWFSFFHEACHILHHGKRTVFLDGPPGKQTAESNEEEEANRFAADFLIPPDDYDRFIEREAYTKARIRSFARRIGITPGIAVGRLQHDGILPYNRANDLKQRFEWGS